MALEALHPAILPNLFTIQLEISQLDFVDHGFQWIAKVIRIGADVEHAMRVYTYSSAMVVLC